MFSIADRYRLRRLLKFWLQDVVEQQRSRLLRFRVPAVIAILGATEWLNCHEVFCCRFAVEASHTSDFVDDEIVVRDGGQGPDCIAHRRLDEVRLGRGQREDLMKIER